MDADTFAAIIAAYSDGTPLKDACSAAGVSKRELSEYVRLSAENADILEKAHESFAAALVAQSIDIADNDPDPQRAGIRVKTRQWVAARLDRKTWGERLDVNVEHRVSISAALDAANARLGPPRDKIIDVTPQAVEIAEPISLEPVDNKSVAPNPFD
jgi:hypothetical protein